jgi:tyrosinase
MEDLSLFSRRDFLRGAGALSAAALTLWAGGCEACLKQIQDRPIRKNIQNLSPTDPIIQTYKAAVAAMKALPTTDNRNWLNQANIHFNNCTHGNWFFLPWHRGYLMYFEKICRKLTGDDKFALPYWNWTTHPAVPDVFWDTSSPLYDANRGVTQSMQASSSWVGASVIQNILSQTNFEIFASGPPVGGELHFATNTGMLEGNPHNNIHNWIDSSDMGSFQSPRDPVFWTHHNMLDCLWVDWNINMNNSNTSDTSWTNQQFNDFFDENGNPAGITVIDTVLYPIFLYRFEPCGPNETQSKRSKDQLEQFLRAGAPSKWDVVKHFELAQSIRTEVGKVGTGSIKIEPNAFSNVLESSGKTAVVLTIGEVEIPEKHDYFVRVFINKPDVSTQTSIDDPHYAGSFALFSDESSMKNHQEKDTAHGRPKAGFVVNISPTLRKLSQAGSLSGEKVDVSLVPTPYEGRQSEGQALTIGRLELKTVSY